MIQLYSTCTYRTASSVTGDSLRWPLEVRKENSQSTHEDAL